MILTCENYFCIYQKNGTCVLDSVNIDSQGLCENCIYPLVDLKKLEELKKKIPRILLNKKALEITSGAFHFINCFAVALAKFIVGEHKFIKLINGGKGKRGVGVGGAVVNCNSARLCIAKGCAEEVRQRDLFYPPHIRSEINFAVKAPAILNNSSHPPSPSFI